ncbi:murein L,D-transpeptidase catalytic domain family protein [Chitinophaga defluvii]|uniref:Murein L,D-transpeptidase catalytic domain family protein n=1 Tax=Chitinophaga defluvii TaxID=3163343 RepID=A0ABV2T3F8_9BACT
MKLPIYKKILFFLMGSGVLMAFFFNAQHAPAATLTSATALVPVLEKRSAQDLPALYEKLALDSLGLSPAAFDYAVQGYNHLLLSGRIKREDILSIIDFSLPSSKKRLFVIDLRQGKLLFNTLVSHGRNSGRETATTFSNEPDSYKSSLGFYITAETYRGEHGYSLRLQGEEKGINDNAMSRGIVMHSADYVNERFARSQGYIGRSLGCPAIPQVLHRKIIESIRNGTCLFLYSPDKFYAKHSRILANNA